MLYTYHIHVLRVESALVRVHELALTSARTQTVSPAAGCFPALHSLSDQQPNDITSDVKVSIQSALIITLS